MDEASECCKARVYPWHGRFSVSLCILPYSVHVDLPNMAKDLQGPDFMAVYQSPKHLVLMP